MIAPIQRRHAQRGAVIYSMVMMPQKVAGNARITRTIAPGLVVHHHQEIDEHGREHDADRQIPERGVHASSIWDPRHLDPVFARRHIAACIAARISLMSAGDSSRVGRSRGRRVSCA